MTTTTRPPPVVPPAPSRPALRRLRRRYWAGRLTWQAMRRLAAYVRAEHEDDR